MTDFALKVLMLLRSDAFLRLPSATEYPDYYDEISSPMSLGLVKQVSGVLQSDDFSM